MRIRTPVACLALVACLSLAAAAGEDHGKAGEPGQEAKMTPSSVLDFTVKDIDGKPVKLGEAYQGKVLLVVNTASKCGHTPQYADLEALYKKYHERGLEILAFPSNDFGAQEPGTESEIKAFCTSKYNVTFPLFTKIDVKGETQAPLYRYLTDDKAHPGTGGEIKWNFTKFLVGRDGKIIARFESAVKPTDEQVVTALGKALDAKAPAAAN